ncbi:hypothetical protein Taro_048239, partial [Colocasia esculenta]|nr:hypothetical protein [Colocasia esculenta]
MGQKYTLLGSWEAGLEHPREEETAPTRSFFPAAFCFNLCRQPFLWSSKGDYEVQEEEQVEDGNVSE